MDTPKLKFHHLDPFTQDFLEALLWSESDESDEQGGNPFNHNYNYSDLAQETLRLAKEDCERFQVLAAAELAALPESYGQGGNGDYSSGGYDFAMTRNGHGVGFWDRDLGGLGDALTAHCKTFPPFNLYLGDPDEDGNVEIYASRG